MQQIFVTITNDKNTAPWVTPFCQFVLALKLLSGDQSQILRDVSNTLVNAHKILIDSQGNEDYPTSCGKF